MTQFCRAVLHAAASAAYTQGSRPARPEAIHDHLAMREQIITRIQEVTREARTMADVPHWLVDLAAQLGVEP